MKAEEVDRLFLDAGGQLKPPAMSYAELVTELQTATGERWLQLAGEALDREHRPTYPRFPDRTGLRGIAQA
jgi:hypothetical protein